MKLTVNSAIATFGAKAKEKLANPAASGQPEDQLRAPFEHLLSELAELSSIPKTAVAAVGESSLSDGIAVHRKLLGNGDIGFTCGGSRDDTAAQSYLLWSAVGCDPLLNLLLFYGRKLTCLAHASG